MRVLDFIARMSAIVLLMISLPLAQHDLTESRSGPNEIPDTFPIFPLRDVVLFPNSSVPLHIFEPRYREMIADSLEGDGIIGMVLLQPGHENDYYGRPPVFTIGCAGQIVDAEELADGRYLVMLRGLSKFRVVREDSSRPYRLATVELISESLDDQSRVLLAERRQRLSEMLSSLSSDPQPLPRALSDAEFIDRVAQAIDLDPAGRQALLEANNVVDRAEALIDIISVRATVPL